MSHEISEVFKTSEILARDWMKIEYFPNDQSPFLYLSNFTRSTYICIDGGVALVVVYTLCRYGWYFNFNDDQALLAPMPLFPENTLYAAVLASTIWITFVPIRWAIDRSNITNIVLTSILLLGLLMSSCRMAIATFMVALGAAFMFYWFEPVRRLGRYKQAIIAISVCTTLLILFALSHLRIPTNDVSLKERLNRYHCALKMGTEKPVFGFGSGTYQFVYFPFQEADDLNRLSLLEPLGGHSPDTYGRGGGVHSEYFQALSEMGYPGLIVWLWLIFSVLQVMLSKTDAALKSEEKYDHAFISLGFVVFLLHGFLNNFLHDGCMAFLFWTAATYISHDNDTSTVLDRK